MILNQCRGTQSRGSQEPRGSKSSDRTISDICREVEARKSLVDRNPHSLQVHLLQLMSRLARASWIEIFRPMLEKNAEIVEARKSLVDRNVCDLCMGPSSLVEARKSLVDRNFFVIVPHHRLRPSRLARASWIEILIPAPYVLGCFVEARKSLVDRNQLPDDGILLFQSRGSQEPRGSKFSSGHPTCVVRLSRARKSLVDRNVFAAVSVKRIKGRGSQEPRGSKFDEHGKGHVDTGRGSQEPRGSKFCSGAFHRPP